MRLRVEAAQHGHSMEEEVRPILRAVLYHQSNLLKGLGSRIHQRCASAGGVDLPLPVREYKARWIKIG